MKVVKPLKILLEPKQENGRLDPSLLVTIKDTNTVRGFDMIFNKVAARAWLAMSGAASDAGHDLFPTDKGFGTYRSFEQQVAGFKFHYTLDHLEGRPTKPFEGKTYFLKPGFEEAGTPGTSNHGLGLAIDVAFLDTSPRPSDKRSIWVLENYERFGFSHEFSDMSDPRHIRYFAGDKIPEAVLGTGEVPSQGGGGPTQIKEDEMLPIITNLEATRGVEARVIKLVVMDDGRLRVLDEDEWKLRGALEGTAWTNEQINSRTVIE
ncbi:MAG TPA: M15 family metallopeptidase [Ilumatobacteraceae bacterium]|nr:M15 family metallopeptidase [Ilumatobacteraceae bacterium]